MATTEQICNLALTHLAVNRRIVDFDADVSPEARACRAFLPQALEEMLRQHPWSFAVGFATLDPVQDDPTSEWPYSHRLPEDCVVVHRIVQEDSSRNETRQSRARWRIVRDNVSGAYDGTRTYDLGEYASVAGVWYRSLTAANLGNAPAATPGSWVAITGVPPRLIYSDLADVVIEYSALVDVRELTPDAAAALAALLAVYILPSVTEDEKGVMTQRAVFFADRLMLRAKANDANEDSPDEPQPSEFERSRL